MLIIKDKGYFAEVYQWAIEHRHAEALDNSLVYLHTYGGGWEDQHGWNVELNKDWAEHSFNITFRRSNPDGTERVIYGGLIFHGDNWGVHT